MKHFTQTPIGIVGLGDLGTQLAKQMLAANQAIIVFDKNQTRVQQFITSLSANERARTTLATSTKAITKQASFIHFAIPSQLINFKVFSLGGAEQIFVLHDSVMGNSLPIARQHAPQQQIQIAHWLMNKHNTVLVARDTSPPPELLTHFQKIGLAPQLIAVKKHDDAMAISQGLAAHIISSGVLNQLNKLHQDNLLTPSGQEFRAFLKNRESQWTETTISSLITNPQLQRLLNAQPSVAHSSPIAKQ